MDSIVLHNIELLTHIGVPEAERKEEQRLRITIELFHPTSDVAASDDITHGIDYQAITESIVALGKTERRTIERLAEDIASTVLQQAKPQGGVRVTVMKQPDLPLESASVTIQRP